ncbi:uncharacterized protein LOC122382768 isoform X5 [Amphibalanus amphitrite]|uniref:uncharacterized protein LOC122382768 isoform X5 n=1 Tax=Amphibalanus amphitrite TaxID=1232801 RepID=UPI001C90EE69|nr:uncharacterized protein LOC122382768 isoform X5 [Amphibalanus amphitrite]
MTAATRRTLSKGLGKLKDFQLTVPIDPGVTPVAQKVRRIPFSLQGPVEQKLKELLDQDIIEQANGSVERQNRTLLKAIRTAVAEGRSWPSSLPTFLLAYRTTPHPATGVSPAELLCGRRLRTKMPAASGPAPAPDRPVVQQRNARYREAGKRYADRQRHTMPANISVGDRVLVKIPNRLTKLSGAFFSEPYRVVSVSGSQVTVRRPDGKLFKRNSSYVKQYVEPRDFVEPFSLPRREGPACAATPSARADRPPDEAADQCVGLRTRSGRLSVKPQWFGNVVSH